MKIREMKKNKLTREIGPDPKTGTIKKYRRVFSEDYDFIGFYDIETGERKTNPVGLSAADRV